MRRSGSACARPCGLMTQEATRRISRASSRRSGASHSKCCSPAQALVRRSASWSSRFARRPWAARATVWHSSKGGTSSRVSGGAALVPRSYELRKSGAGRTRSGARLRHADLERAEHRRSQSARLRGSRAARGVSKVALNHFPGGGGFCVGGRIGAVPGAPAGGAAGGG
jgi:hypothetical protein